MQINFICVGTKMPSWVTQGYQEYAKRMTKDCRLKLVEVEMAKRSKTSSIDKLKLDEARKIQSIIPRSTHLVVLDVPGKQWSTEKLSQRVDHWMHLGKDVSLLVGGPDGLDNTVLQSADETWSLSNLTLPHPLVRVVVAEQLYRAWSLLNNHPYHRA